MRYPVLVFALAVAGVVAPAGAQTPTPEASPRQRAHSNPPESGLGTLPPGVGIPVGEEAPDARLRSADGSEVSLHDLTRGGAALLVFYRGGWCPYCNFQIRQLTETYPELRRRGVTPVAISVDRVQEAARTQATYEIPFPVLSDPDLAAHRAYRVLHQADAAEVARLGAAGIDLERSSGRAHHVIATPALFVIDREGVVRWAHADPDYKVRPSPAQILAAIDGLAPRP
ncbi:MAG: peroxiredoxin family protein [Vicinamibacteria bacterium]